ncbi:glutamyl-tRNA reductase [Intrasporangium calvum]|uniref:Glutamyl-tRNA reductase n=1 Tax=Intrasporangium calvum TaxID=53358 RepID=A0ABT5GE40_9MICO|nr:glutamyl-tRNA reductase [Intrasporangium calvum]MDC5696423.1 glutamyl-tRNA reductase [Intrasporangium calvum]
MSLLVIGLSHHTAPLAVLEGLAESPDRAANIASTVLSSATATEVVVVSTCNRLEVYAEVPAFHPAVAAIGEALATAAGTRPEGLPCGLDVRPADPAEELAVRAEGIADHLYVRFDDSAVAHTFTVACGLDSMAVGEAQILGQMRDALAVAQQTGRAGESLNSLFQHALRVGKRAHSETDIDQHSLSLVQMGLEEAEKVLGDLSGCRAAVVGAGAMSGLAVATAARSGINDLTVVNRTPSRAERLAASVGGTARPWGELEHVILASDLVITCTGAVGHVIPAELVARSAAARDGRPQVFIDLALPRDVAPADSWAEPVATARVIDLEELGVLLAGRADLQQVDRVGELVTAEVADYLTRRIEKKVAPTVAALRSRAAAVVATELDRLHQKVPDLDDGTRAEIGRAVHRIVEKLLHTPTARIKEFAVDPNRPDYAAALRELFDLEPKDVANVSSPPKRGVS